MNRYLAPPLSDFLGTLVSQATFPFKQLGEYLSRKSPSKSECYSALTQALSKYQKDCLSYRKVAIAIWVCCQREVDQSIDDCLNFFESLLKSRLLLLVFDSDGQFVLSKILIYLSPVLESTIKRTFEMGYYSKILRILQRLNSPKSKFNEILFLLEYLIIRKIQKNLDQSSLQSFEQMLKRIIPKIKLDKIGLQNREITFRTIVYYRNSQDSCQTYQLVIKDQKVTKQIDRGVLPQWVLDAYVRYPRSCELSLFRSRRLYDVFGLCSKIQVFGSSPLIEDLEDILKDGEFVELLTKFLLRHPISQQKYQYDCLKARKTAEQFRRIISSQNEVYQIAIAEQAFNRIRI